VSVLDDNIAVKNVRKRVQRVLGKFEQLSLSTGKKHLEDPNCSSTSAAW
jgi:hypothetical protein